MSGKLSIHGPMLNNHVPMGFLSEPKDDRCLREAFIVVTLISAHTKITMKRQNDILSAVFDRVVEVV